MADPKPARGPRLLAEAIGTFMLVGLGAGAAAIDLWSRGAVTHLGIACAFGAAVLVAVYGLGHISGAHINPAVTVAFWAAGRFPRSDVLPYISAQLIGATVASAGLRILVGGAMRGALTTPVIGTVPGFLVETVLTFILMLVIMAVATDARVAGPVAGLAVGTVVAVDALVGGPLTGASMNPARSFAPALITDSWTAQWIYWLGPCLGAVLSVSAYDYMRTGTAHDARI